MNNIAIRTKTDNATPVALNLTLRRLALVIATFIFCIVLISFRPFTPVGVPGSLQSGDMVNQLGFSLVGTIALASLAMLAQPQKIRALISPAWLLMLGFLVLSIFASPDPGNAVRGVGLTIVGLIAIVAVLALPRDGNGYSTLLRVSAFIIIGLSYFGVLFLPHLGTHGADVVEPQNSFLWRGVFTHKNIAGPVMATLSFGGLYLWRRGWKISGAIIAISALWFVANTGSKTTAALVPFAMLVVLGPGIFGLRNLAPFIIFIIQTVFALLTFGTVLFEPIHHLVTELGVDSTFTGRSSIWLFALDALQNRPWTGFGYESFWNTNVVKQAANPYHLDWDVRGIVHAHNSYLDIAVSMGLPAFVCALIVIIIMPLVYYFQCRKNKENLLLADFFLMFVFFGTLNAMLESFFFRRMDPVWLMLIFAIFGLRMVSRIIIPRTIT